MAKSSKIDYVDASWNPWIGCRKISDGCENCYMYRQAKQFGFDPQRVHRSSDKTFYAPLTWKEPKRILVCSWSDFWVNSGYKIALARDAAVNVMKQCPQHTFMITTKRPIEMTAWIGSLSGGWHTTLGDNVWLGVSVENKKAVKRIPYLLDTPADHRWLSIEPLIAPVQLPDTIKGKVDLVVIGCESGPNRRPCELKWVTDIVDHLTAMDIPVFVKQLDINGKVSHNPNEWDEWLRRRDLP